MYRTVRLLQRVRGTSLSSRAEKSILVPMYMLTYSHVIHAINLIKTMLCLYATLCRPRDTLELSRLEPGKRVTDREPNAFYCNLF